MGIKSIVTCHAGARDHYQLSLAFEEFGLLDTLVTDFYMPNYLKKCIKKRFNDDLSACKASWRLTDAFNGLYLKKYAQLGQSLSLRAAHLAMKHQSNLFACSYTANAGFKYLEKNNSTVKKYLFQLHPHPNLILSILEDEVERGCVSRDELFYEAELDVSFTESLSGEAYLADEICVASSFTKKSLIHAGIPDQKIRVIPYGVDGGSYLTPIKRAKGKLRILFCGQFIHRKGISYLYQALQQIDSRHYELTIVTRGDCDEKLLVAYQRELNANIYRNISNGDLIKIMHQSNLFILPSLYEGFGHVILEAMSVGLPIITTKNTGGYDLITDYQEGFVGPIRDINFLVEKILFFLDCPSALRSFGEQAALTAKSHTWNRFREEVTNFYIQTEALRIS